MQTRLEIRATNDFNAVTLRCDDCNLLRRLFVEKIVDEKQTLTLTFDPEASETIH